MKQLSLFEKQESLDVINYQIRSCKKCNLCTTRKHALAGEGNVDASIMFVALSPGIKENAENKMFIGPSGQVFNKLLLLAGIDKNRSFMTNLIKCMLPNNRTPKMTEIESCSQFLDEEISVINPEVIVPLGAFATKTIVNKFNLSSLYSGYKFSDLTGKVLAIQNIKIYPLPHPAALLYNPSFEADTIKKYKKLISLV